MKENKEVGEKQNDIKRANVIDPHPSSLPFPFIFITSLTLLIKIK